MPVTINILVVCMHVRLTVNGAVKDYLRKKVKGKVHTLRLYRPYGP